MNNGLKGEIIRRWFRASPKVIALSKSLEELPEGYGFTSQQQQTYKTTNKWIIENIRRYDNQLPLTGDHYQYRELTLER